MKRSAEILRSVLPAQPAQLMFLSGVVCLFIAPQLRWHPPAAPVPPADLLLNPRALLIPSLFAIQFAGCTGYFVCFRPGSHPFRRLVWWVCLPALVGLIVQCSFYLKVGIVASPFRADRISLRNIGWSFALLWDLGPGFHYALIGLLLVGVFTWRITRGSASLPLALPESSVSSSDDALSWRCFHIPVWILVLWAPLMWGAGGVAFALQRSQLKDWLQGHAWVVGALSYGITFATSIGLIGWMIGEEAWRAFRRSVRLPPRPQSLLLAMAFAVGAAFLGSAAYYFFERARWAVHFYRGSVPPQFAFYLGLPTVGLISFLIPPAFFEEVIYRGLLQPRFVRRYGPLRGILLVGIVWAAGHFSHDFSPRFTDRDVLLQLGLRLLGCAAQSSVLGWLTLRTGSILPGTLAHAIYNSFAESPLRRWGPPQGALIDLSWALLGYALFRHWPVQIRGVDQSGAGVANPAPHL